MTTNATKTPVTTPDNVFLWLDYLVRVSGLSYRQVAAKPFFSGIPPGTINTMRKYRYMPKKWRKKLHATDRRNRIAVNLDDPVSAAKSIKGRQPGAEYIAKLAKELVKG